jgi:hypothetical protein
MSTPRCLSLMRLGHVAAVCSVHGDSKALMRHAGLAGIEAHAVEPSAGQALAGIVVQPHGIVGTTAEDAGRLQSAMLGKTVFPPFQTERAPFDALRFPVGPNDSDQADSSRRRRGAPAGKLPSSACLAASISDPFIRLPLTDLHRVPAITARRLAPTPPPPSASHAGMCATYPRGQPPRARSSPVPPQETS